MKRFNYQILIIKLLVSTFSIVMFTGCIGAKQNIQKAYTKKYSNKTLMYHYAKKYGIDPQLVKAIIDVESGWNPKSISNKSAYGLMQIVPNTAGIEVNRYFNISKNKPSKYQLLHPVSNLQYGILYLHILQNHYLKKIKNNTSKRYLTIAAYNRGITMTLKVFDKYPRNAVKKINRYTPKQVYYKLMRKLPLETRRYLKKVSSNI